MKTSSLSALRAHGRLAAALAFAFFAGFALPSFTLSAQARVAFLGFSNSGGDPRFDYLAGFMGGIVEFDLSRDGKVSLVERANLDAILREQEISLNLSEEQAAKIGGIAGAQYLLRGDYTVMGEDVALNLKLIDVATSKASVFSGRGSGENAIHALVERVIQKASGDAVTLRSEEHDRSLLSLTDAKPGSINLHTQLIDAEIWLDGKFAGYSTGDIRNPFKIEGLDPGKHEVSIKLKGFGVVKKPELSFADWSETVVVKPGKLSVVKANAQHLGYALEDIKKLLDEQTVFDPDKKAVTKAKTWDLSYQDRSGRKIPVTLKLDFGWIEGKGGFATGELSVDGKRTPVNLDCPLGAENRIPLSLGGVSGKIDLDFDASNRYDISLDFQRDDITGEEWMQ